MTQIFLNESIAERRRVPVFLTDISGIAQESGTVTASKISKNGGTFVSSSGSLTEVSDGWYYLELEASELDTLGYLAIRISTNEALDFADTVQVINPTVDIGQIDGDSSAATNLKNTFNGSGYEDLLAPAQQRQLSDIANVGAAINKSASSVVVSSGTETGIVLNTVGQDNIYHQVAISAGNIDLYYEFEIGNEGVPVGVSFNGRLNRTGGPITFINVFGFDWLSSSWIQIGTLDSISNSDSADDATTIYSLLLGMVGTGANSGKVRVRFAKAGMTRNEELFTDQIFVSFSIIVRSAGYANAAICIDTINGTPGTTPFINGTVDNAVDSLADATILSNSLNMNRIELIQGSDITFVQSYDNYAFFGKNWDLNLNSQSISDIVIDGANISGICTAINRPHFNTCRIINVTLPPCDLNNCGIVQEIILENVGDYFFDNCYSEVAGINTPSIDFGSGIGTTNVNLRHYSGGIEVKNMGQSGIDNMSLEGFGQLVINANCVSGIIAIRGHFTIIDNASGSITILDNANFIRSETVDAVWNEVSNEHITSGSLGELLSNISVGDGSVLVNHNFGGVDNLIVKNNLGVPIDNVIITAFLKSDFDAGNTGTIDIVGQTRTNVLGRWSSPLRLDSATYIIIFAKQGVVLTGQEEIIVS